MPHKNQFVTVLLLCLTILCFAMWLWFHWELKGTPDGGSILETRIGLPFSPWMNGTITWTPSEVEGAWDVGSKGELNFICWSTLLVIVGVTAMKARSRFLSAKPNHKCELPE